MDVLDEDWLPVDFSGNQPKVRSEVNEPKYHELSTVFVSFEARVRWASWKLLSSMVFEPILMWQGWIVDGRHRHMACLKADVKPTYVSTR